MSLFFRVLAEGCSDPLFFFPALALVLALVGFFGGRSRRTKAVCGVIAALAAVVLVAVIGAGMYLQAGIDRRFGA